MDTQRDRPGAMPLQARPVHRDGPEAGARDARTGAVAAMSSCATKAGPARQMCYAQYGVAG
ncbi:hypothetical protein [Streptomyces sp. NBC_00572]|uniref:hypothetical protein n=1 Tax=Streptomyces sp. NBC_00572 TaxID=2903664 RepID=UPI00225957F2|nr:hypothetical protein [Streptomyces sp. NBC_00572]MCX4982490.1 hypothetical protein [Streptomyces sp. NBC_00572]